MKFLSAAAACTLSATFMVAVNGAPLALKDKRMVVSFAAYPDVEGPIKREADAEADPMVVSFAAYPDAEPVKREADPMVVSFAAYPDSEPVKREAEPMVVSFAAYPDVEGPAKRDASKISYRSPEASESK
ncbi:hypothetical protein MMC10_005895 [Thelotrema lepadinum]|nr:hypothetical protein [Thelotrema lepadinum]